MLLELEVRGSTTELEPRYVGMLEPLTWYAGSIEDPELARRNRAEAWTVQPIADLALTQILLAAAAHDPVHEEVWLDTAADLRAVHRGYLWARAEAARWRGDEQSERSWLMRLDALTALADSEDRALLLHVAGL